MDVLARLAAIEEIRHLKARYFRFLDLQDWPAYCALFTVDGVLEVESLRRKDDAGAALTRKETGRTAIGNWISSVLDGAVTVHHGHMPEINVTSAEHATAIWAMEDLVQWPDRAIHGFGHYHDVYKREDGAWRIAASRLTRLRVDVIGAASQDAPRMLDS
jgi:hypothetical protein